MKIPNLVFNALIVLDGVEAVAGEDGCLQSRIMFGDPTGNVVTGRFVGIRCHWLDRF